LTKVASAITFRVGYFPKAESKEAESKEEVGDEAMPIAVDDARLDETFSALANSTRRAILARLAAGSATVNELAEPFAMTLPAISKHIKVLERAGLVVRGRQAQFRPCAIDAEPLAAVSSWAEQYREIWESSFDRMDDYLARLQPARRSEGD
jgi:DNA-binding transcriptional ArsR family regulator